MKVNNANSKTIRIPIVIGKNRLKGHSKGAMVFDECSHSNLDTLRNVISMEARMQGIEPKSKWLSKAVKQMLGIYEKAYGDWQKGKGGCIGFIYECDLPSGQVVLLG